MSWSISELDENKTMQAIENETVRIINCNESLEKLKKEYENKRSMYMVELSNMEDKITTLESSIASGEKFLNECKNHLKDFE